MRMKTKPIKNVATETDDRRKASWTKNATRYAIHSAAISTVATKSAKYLWKLQIVKTSTPPPSTSREAHIGQD